MVKQGLILKSNDLFQSHPWFAGLDWDSVREMQAPFVPDVSSPTDTSNFDVDDTDIRLVLFKNPYTYYIYKYFWLCKK